MGGRDIVCSYAGCGCGRVLSGGPVYEKIRAAGVGGCEWGEVDERMIVVTVHSILYLTSPRQNAIMKKKQGGDKAAASWPLMIAYAIISRPIRCREAS